MDYRKQIINEMWDNLKHCVHKKVISFIQIFVYQYWLDEDSPVRTESLQFPASYLLLR